MDGTALRRLIIVGSGTYAEDRTYIGGLFEKAILSGTTSEYRHYIVANDKPVAVKIIGPTNDTYYLHDDHLCSTDVVTRSSGAVVVRESFDAWGSGARVRGWARRRQQRSAPIMLRR